MLEQEKPRLHKIARTALSTWKVRQIKAQGGVCPVSGREFDMANLKDAVVDHCHLTGEIRGVLLRSANAVEGKVKNAVARWGGVGEDYSKIIPYLERLVAYLKQPGTGFMYPMHKSPEEQKDARNAKARQRRAEAKAKVALRSRRKE